MSVALLLCGEFERVEVFQRHKPIATLFHWICLGGVICSLADGLVGLLFWFCRGQMYEKTERHGEEFGKIVILQLKSQLVNHVEHSKHTRKSIWMCPWRTGCFWKNSSASSVGKPKRGNSCLNALSRAARIALHSPKRKSWKKLTPSGARNENHPWSKPNCWNSLILENFWRIRYTIPPRHKPLS